MSLRNILRLLALMQQIVIVDSLNDGLYEGVVEDVPHDLLDFAVTGMAPGHTFLGDYDYLWIEVD